MKRLLFTFFFSLLTFSSFVKAEESDFTYYIQSGVEYDSNVFKTFDQSEGDFLARVLFHADGRILETPKTRISFNYDGGGKKFIERKEQDMIIQSLNVPISLQVSPKNSLYFRTSLKYQNERNLLDDAGLDVNEDFISVRETFYWSYLPAPNHRFRLLADAGYFHFSPRDSFSFFSERVGVEYQYQIKSGFWLSTQYGMLFQQFRSDRRDTQLEASIGLHAFVIPYFSFQYQFEKNNSNVDLFDSSNHRFTLLVSHLLGKKANDPDSALFSIHLLTTLQVRNFPSVDAFTEEGERYLLTSAEDQNFNHITFKLAYHPSDAWTVETKYSRFSNEFSSQDSEFSRNLYYLGLRYKI